MRRWIGALVCALVIGAAIAPATALGAAARTRPKLCAQPGLGQAPQTATPQEESLDPAAVQRAMLFAQTHNRLFVEIYRNNCLVASSALAGLTGDVPWNIWSSTKSVIALLAGVAFTQGKLQLDAPIDRYLPPGLGDAAHRAIRVEDLLTQSSGIQSADLTELATGGDDIDAPAQALALPLRHEPGTFFDYSQRGVDLMAYVVQRAVGMDLQAFAQRYLFGPIGIPANSYLWLRDRTGHTYGWADLFLRPNDFAKLGLLFANSGAWNGWPLIAPIYMSYLQSPSPANACYGYLVWLNHAPCVAPTLPSRQTFDVQPFFPMPADTYATIGFGQQNNFVTPSLHMVVTWTGEYGDVSLDPQTLLASSPDSELYHDFFRLLAPAVQDVQLPASPPYTPIYNLDIDPLAMADVMLPLGALGFGTDAPPSCNLLTCSIP